MTEALQQPLPLHQTSDDTSGVSADLVLQSLFGFVPAAIKAPQSTAAAPTAKRRIGKAKQPQELIGRSVRKLFADGKKYKVHCSTKGA